MNFFEQHILSLTLFSPLLGIVPIFLFPKNQEKALKLVVFILSLIPFFLAVVLWKNFRGSGELEFLEITPWMKGYPIYYRLGVDGLSLPLIVLTTLLMPLVILSSWNDVQKNIKSYLFFFLLLESSMIGVLSSLDLFLFYVFWELQLIPMFFLIGGWGGSRRLYAAVKFVLYTMVGSLPMLAAILYLFFTGGKTFNVHEISLLQVPQHIQLFLFGAFTLAFIIKVPLFPFHTWLPDAHVEAPTGGSVILAGILLKMGTYGLMRFSFYLFPTVIHQFLPLLQILAVIGVVYGSLIAMVQPDLKKLVAYTSVAHLGFVVLGITSLNMQGVTGATLQMLNHGISTGALFLLVGMIYERRHTRQIADFGGLAHVMPIYTILFLVVMFSSIALPMTNGFVGEFLILLGSFKAQPVYATIASTGVVLGAGVMLWMVKKTFYGPLTHEENKQLKDVSLREVLVVLPLIILILWIGIFPNYFLKKIEPTTKKWVSQVSQSQEAFKK